MKNLTTILLILFPFILSAQEFKNSVTVDYSVNYFSSVYDPAHLSSFQYGRKSEWGSLLGRLNAANRFEMTGSQLEIDAYPKIAKGVYAYLNYGSSASVLFPKHRIGAEIYSSFPKSFEGSIGFRYLYYGGSSDVTIYTASAGYYYGDYWFSLRSFITPGDVSFSRSVGLTVRYYLSTADDYLTIKIGAGFSPDERNYDPANGSVYLLESQSVGLGLQKRISDEFIMSVFSDYTKQELVFSQGEFVRVFSINAGLTYKF